jgi:aspartyl-tRNA(Asn)/glutamyl-tRNA(Gln) amidotransferase subunit C
MEINIELLRKVAKVARLNLTDEELQEFLPDFKEVIEIFSKLNDVDTKDIDLSYLPIKLKNVFREDDVKPSLTNEEALINANHKQDGYFKGPKII